MIEIIASIFAAIMANLFSNLLYDQLHLDVGLGPWFILLVFLAYILARILAWYWAYVYIHFRRPEPDNASEWIRRKEEYIKKKMANGLPISGFVLGLLLCKQYYPWTDGWLSLLTWLVASFPSILTWWGLERSEFDELRYGAKISDRMTRYKCVTEKWLREAFPRDEPYQIRRQMGLYVQRTFGQAERLDISNPANWVIRWGGHGREAGYVYHGSSSP